MKPSPVHIIAPVQNESPRARALRAIRGWISDGSLTAGEVLPPEREISNMLGVGLGTVQRALKVMESEGYIVRRAGRTRIVATPETNDVGLLSDSVLVFAETMDFLTQFNGPVYGWGGYVAAGVLNGLAEQKAHAMLLHPGSLEISTLERMLGSGPQGMVIPEVDQVSIDPLPWAHLASQSGVPVTVFGNEAGSELYDRVVPDHEAGAYELTKWLISQGRRRIVHTTTGSLMKEWIKARLRGYESAMRQAGLTPMAAVIIPEGKYPSLNPEGSFRASSQAAAGALLPHVMVDDSIDAIMTITDGHVPSIIHGLRMLGKKPQQDVLVVGYDDYWDQTLERAWESLPPAATVNKNNFQVGRELAMLLRQRREGKLPPEPQVRLIKPTLCIRNASDLIGR